MTIGEGRLMSESGYEPTKAGLIETQPSPQELHALITPTLPRDALGATCGTRTGVEALAGVPIRLVKRRPHQ